MGDRLSDEELDRLRANLKAVQGNAYADVDLADLVVRIAPSLLDEVQEAREDEGVYRVWRRRCVEAETRIEELEAQVAHLNKACDRWKIDAHRAEAELSAAHESAQGCAEELARVADELRVLKRRCSVPHTWELTTDGKRCMVCGRREDFIADDTEREVEP